MKEHTKLCQKQLSKVNLYFVWGQLLRKQTVLPILTRAANESLIFPFKHRSKFLASWSRCLVILACFSNGKVRTDYTQLSCFCVMHCMFPLVSNRFFPKYQIFSNKPQFSNELRLQKAPDSFTSLQIMNLHQTLIMKKMHKISIFCQMA